MLTEARIIFSDSNIPLHQRIEAASLVLKYQATPDLVADATEFLKAVSMSPAIDYRLNAIEALARRGVPQAGTPGGGGGAAAAVGTGRTVNSVDHGERGWCVCDVCWRCSGS